MRAGLVLQELLGKLSEAANNTVEKGNSFERLIASYLRTAPEFADRFDGVWLWQEWPERGNVHDHGIDIVARDTHTNGWCAIQCKFYDPNHHVAKGDIDSFLAASGKRGFTSRLIFSTAKSWGPTAEKQLDNLQIPVVRIGYEDLLESKVDWSQFDFLEPPDILPTSDRNTPYPHQREAIRDVINGLANQDRGQLIMACGTGKTFTALKIAEDVADSRKPEPTNVLFLVPSLQLLNQSLREWKQESGIPFRAFAVCSDVRVGQNEVEDITTHDLIYPATTDAATLAAEVKKDTENHEFTVIFSTYQSIDVVAQAQAAGLPELDLIICDEAHRTTGVTLAGEDESHFVRVHDNDYLRAAKRLYMTATPRLFDPNTKEKAQDADAVLASMDDDSIFGPVLHRLGFGEAVERDLLTDYKVLVLTVDEGYVAENFQAAIAASGEIQLGDAAKIIGCWNGLAKKFGELSEEDAATTDLTPMRRAVAFAKNIKTSKATRDAFPAVISQHATELGEEASHLGIDIQHVDGTMNALERNALMRWLKDGPNEDDNSCRVLTNVRCLSEGVDVPALDAVMFLTPRASQVDVVQSVGRVMRKSRHTRKDFGYIILPVVVPAGVPADQALNDNERFKVIWQVLQALRAHDDRFNAMVNKIDLNTNRPDKIQIFDVGGREEGETKDPKSVQLTFDIEEWRDSIYARIVKRVGERRYWETWAKDVAEIAQQHIIRINGLLADSSTEAASEFEAFLEGLRGNLNDGISQDDAIEMLAQHLITRPVFDALFGGYDFAAHNPIAQAMERMLAVLDEHSLDTENESLEKFYRSVRSRVEGVDNAEGRQKIIVELYDKFFATAFKKTVDKLGIVYTPIEIVDFILRSADEVLRAEFGQGLTDEGVHILDGFVGTGTFIVRLIQSGLIEPHDLARKYANELHANEILLLAYYIAAINIETAYQDAIRGHVDVADYEPFPGLILTDTFQSWEDDDRPDLKVFPENNERLEQLKQLPITVIVGNPPYSSGQDSANDDNQNESYPSLDDSIRTTYAARSSNINKVTLYDSYIRAIKWATLRIKDRGVVAFVTNGGFLDSNTADGMRRTLADEFSAIYVFNLRGNQRTAGEVSRKEGGKVFDAGSRATVAVTLLVKDSGFQGPATIRYAQVDDYLTRAEKLSVLAETPSMRQAVTEIVKPNAAGDWINQRSEDFESFLPLGDKRGSAKIFGDYSGGLSTARDAWAFNSSEEAVAQNLQRLVRTYSEDLSRVAESGATANATTDPKLISWSTVLRQLFDRRRPVEFHPEAVARGVYRPFFRQWCYRHNHLIHSAYRLGEMFPSAQVTNFGFFSNGFNAQSVPAVLALDAVPSLDLFGKGGQFFSRWRYEMVASEGTLTLDEEGEVHDGYRRLDNITDWALERFRYAYGQSFTRDDVFYYVYGILHSTDYRERYDADLKKMLPRVPLVLDAEPFVSAGRRLIETHLGYETATPYPLEGLDVRTDDDEFNFFRVGKMRFKSRNDKSSIVYNDQITLSGIPDAAHRYMLGSRSAIEWIIDRYQMKTDKKSGIVNDPNDWSREVGDPRYIIDLVARIVTVSLETMKIVDALPPLEILDDQG